MNDCEFLAELAKEYDELAAFNLSHEIRNDYQAARTYKGYAERLRRIMAQLECT